MPASLTRLISVNANNIPVLNGANFKDWKENMLIVLGCMDLDLALRTEQPASLTAANTSDQRKDFEKWERSNLLSLMIIKRGIPEAFRGTVSEGIIKASVFLAEIEKRFAKNDKAETSTLLSKLISMKFKGKGNIREYIMEMSHTASKLKALKLDFSEDFLVHLVLISLPLQYGQFKVNYNCQKEKWTLNELISYFAKEEERLKQEKHEIAQLTTASAPKDKGKKKAEDKAAAKGLEIKKQKGGVSCFFCKHSGHMKEDCMKYKVWLAKKGTYISLVCSEANLASALKDTWWMDSGATIHISVSLQGCLSSRAPSDGERYIFGGDGELIKVEAIAQFRLLLSTGHYLDMKDTFVVPSFRRNLVSVSVLDKSSFYCSFGNEMFSLSKDSNVIGNGTLSYCDNLYSLDIAASYKQTLHVDKRGAKRKLSNEHSAKLWHRRLGHVSKFRMERLVSEEILQSLDFSEFDVCVGCIKGKQTKQRRLGTNRSLDVLELIHTDICGPFSKASWNGQ